MRPLYKDSHVMLAKLQERFIRFPKLFGPHLAQGFARLAANSAADFLTTRSYSHLSLIAAVQFILQTKMENALLQQSEMETHLFLKLFRSSGQISAAFAVSSSQSFHREQLLAAFRTLLPGVHERPRSFYLWHHPELPYLFCYLELYSLRGVELTRRDLRTIEASLKNQLEVVPPLTPALFWPYNEEESYRQIQLLQREVVTIQDLPHVSLHFQEQTPVFLEFLVHMVRPKASSGLDRPWEHLFDASCHFHRIRHAFELAAFSVKVPTHLFDVRDSINLLYARRYVLKQLETVMGPFRDYNGGLFEKQQHHFETIRLHLGQKLPYFDLFAEKLFYALHPVELRLSLSLEDAEALFSAFSQVLCKEALEVSKGRVSCVRVVKSAELPTYKMKPRGEARLTLGQYHYLCRLESEELQEQKESKKEPHTLRLLFHEGAPLSLNPYHASGDMRCRILSKLLFEGLTRLNARGEVELTGALSVEEKGCLYTFQLRPCYWSNGERVSAQDFVLGFQLALNDPISHPEWLFLLRGGRAFRAAGGGELGIRALQVDVLQIELERPDPLFLRRLAEPIFFPLFGSIREPKWFNGPYLVREMTSEHILLEKNPYFWRREQLYFERMEIRWESSAETIHEQFIQGAVDWIGDPLTTLSSSSIQKLQSEGLLQKQSVRRRFLLYFNTTHPFLSSRWIRQALSCAIDRSWIARSLFPQSTPLAPLSADPESARSFFRRGLKELGLRTAPSLLFSYSHEASRKPLALYLQSVWKEVLDLHVELYSMDWNGFRSRLERGLFDISGTLQDIDDSLPFWERFEGDNSWNFSRWTHDAYRIAVQAGAWKEAEAILQEEIPFTPFFLSAHLYAHSPHLKGYFFNEEGCVDLSQTWKNSV